MNVLSCDHICSPSSTSEYICVNICSLIICWQEKPKVTIKLIFQESVDSQRASALKRIMVDSKPFVVQNLKVEAEAQVKVEEEAKTKPEARLEGEAEAQVKIEVEAKTKPEVKLEGEAEDEVDAKTRAESQAEVIAEEADELMGFDKSLQVSIKSSIHII